MSFNKSIHFPVEPSGFRVSYVGLPEVSVDEVDASVEDAFNRGKQEATNFYKAEIQQLRVEFANRQQELLTGINQKVVTTVGELEKRLPDLVIGIAERVLGQANLVGSDVEKLVMSMIAEFSDKEEKLEVFLNPEDLKLLKALRCTEEVKDESENEGEEGFASAIAGIFDGLDGDDALLSEYPDVKFFEDDSLQSGDCQIKSRFGLLDGRIATKLRKIEEELKGND